MGIDFPTKEELIAGRYKLLYEDPNYIEQVRKTIGADSLRYQTIDDLVAAIGKSKNQLCLACLTGNYPLKSVTKIAEIENSIAMSRIK